MSKMDFMEHSSTFAGATPEQVFAEFTSDDFLRAFSAEVGVASGELSHSNDGGVESADMPWTFPTDRPGIPSLARKLLPSEVALDWHQEWGPVAANSIPGSMKVDLHGTPSALVTAQASLLQQGTCFSAGCHTAVHGSDVNSHLRY